jgi:hypothetical protein
MTRTNRTWLVGIGVLLGLGFVVLAIAGYILAHRFDPYIRQQVILYLQRGFDSEVELTSLRVRLPRISPLNLLFNGGRGVLAHVEGEGVSLRHKGRRDVPPMFVMKKFSGEIDLRSLFNTPKTVRSVTIDGMEINIPPKGEMPKFGEDERSEWDTGVIVEEVIVTNSSLSILPKDKGKTPLHFDLHRVRLESVGKDVGMRYDATLTNPKPPGEILSKGALGPWTAGEPGDTPLAGEYDFHNADLSVFSSIAGILDSTGRFEGSLSSINVQGQASVPDFRLKMSGNRVPLSTRFEVLVDGTNGNTILKPVNGILGTTAFTTSGGIIKHESDLTRTINLDVTIPKGNIRDLLTLAMKGPPFMTGDIFLQTKIEIPPLTSKVRQKLLLDGRFDLSRAVFLRSKIQDRIDGLSRRGRGQPNSEEIDQVISSMAGAFRLENEVITFRALSFAVAGAGVDLQGSYNLDSDALDFHGALKLEAKVSQTVSGWKRWALKPVDPFFSKQGAGTFLHIKVEGTAKEPKFGLDLGKSGKKTPTSTPTLTTD